MGEISLDYPVGPNVITEFLQEGGRKIRIRKRRFKDGSRDQGGE